MQRRHKPTTHQERRGSALVASLISVMVVASMGAGLMQLHGSISAKQELSIDTKRALYMAEAGLSEAFIAVTQGKSGKVGSPALPARFGDGVYWVEATELVGGRVQLESVGLCGSGRFALSMVLLRESNPIAALGAFGGNTMNLNVGAIVDGYDSEEGTFAEQIDTEIQGIETTGKGGRISSNGDIDLEGGTSVELGKARTTKVFGDAAPGPLSAVNLGTGAEVTGVTLPMPQEVYAPEIEVPELRTYGSLVHNNPSSPLFLGKVDKHYDSISVAPRSKITFCGPTTVVADQLIVESGGQLEFDTSSGPIVVFVPDNLELRNGSVLSSVTEDPTQVAVLVGAPNVTFNPEGEFYGLFYAPNAPVLVPNSLRIFGSAAAEELTLASNAHLSIDHGMLASAAKGIDHLPKFLSWRISELPQDPIVKTRLDPLTQLKLAGVTPTPSPVAHDEKFVRILYRGFDKTVYAYSGPESGLDWSNVMKSIKVMWGKSDSDFADWDGWESYGGADTQAAESAPQMAG